MHFILNIIICLVFRFDKLAPKKQRKTLVIYI